MDWFFQYELDTSRSVSREVLRKKAGVAGCIKPTSVRMVTIGSLSSNASVTRTQVIFFLVSRQNGRMQAFDSVALGLFLE